MEYEVNLIGAVAAEALGTMYFDVHNINLEYFHLNYMLIREVTSK